MLSLSNKINFLMNFFTESVHIDYPLEFHSDSSADNQHYKHYEAVILPTLRFSSITCFFKKFKNEKSSGVKSGDIGCHSVSSLISIHLFRNIQFKKFRTIPLKCTRAIFSGACVWRFCTILGFSSLQYQHFTVPHKKKKASSEKNDGAQNFDFHRVFASSHRIVVSCQSHRLIIPILNEICMEDKWCFFKILRTERSSISCT